LTVVIFASCSKDKPIISHQKFAVIVAELHIAESTAFQLNSDPHAQNLLASRFYMDVLTRNGIKPKDFWNAYDFYRNSPEDMNDVYDMAIEIINEKISRKIK
jgi:hypothetical protein